MKPIQTGPEMGPGTRTRRPRRRRTASRVHRIAAVGGVLAIAATSIIGAAVPAAAADVLASGTVMVDAVTDGSSPASPRRGEADMPLGGATVTLVGGDGSPTAWSTTTDEDGTWSFPDDDYGEVPEPFTVLIDVAGVADDLYVTTSNDDFTVVPGASQQATSRSFTPGDAPVLDAQVTPAWKLALGIFQNEGTHAVLTGTEPFDDDDGAGHDSSIDNARIRTGDLVSVFWSVVASTDVTVGDTPEHTYLEQTITLGTGAVANFERYPVGCEAVSLMAFGPTFPEGKAIEPRVDPPEDATAVTMTCDLGQLEQGSAKAISAQVWVSSTSTADSRFTTSARVYSVDDAGRAQAGPSSDTLVGPIEIASAPRYDLKKWPGKYNEHRVGEFNGQQRVELVRIKSVLTVATDLRRGAEALTDPIVVDDIFWAQYTSAKGSNGEPGALVENLPYQISSCEPSGETVGDLVFGSPGGDRRAASVIAKPGKCAFARDEPGDLTSPYRLTLSGIDTTLRSFPTETIDGTDLKAGPFYVAAFAVYIDVPASEVDKAQGPVADGLGELDFYNRLAGFDPKGVSGSDNYGGVGEPGYCTVGPAAEKDTNCKTIDKMRSNNVLGPQKYKLTPKDFGNLSLWKDMVDPVRPWVNLQNRLAAPKDRGNAQVLPGSVHGSLVKISSGDDASGEGVQACDIFDNKTARLVPLKAMWKVDQTKMPADLYSYVLTSRDPAVNKELTGQLTVEYSHTDLSADQPNTGVLTDNRWEGDWTQQRAANCDQEGLVWSTDPTKVAGGIDEVNIVRLTAPDGVRLEPNASWDWWLALEQRVNYHGGSRDGQLVPPGAVFANYSRARSASREWTDPDYIPGAGWTNDARQTGVGGTTIGDRWTVTKAFMKILQHTIAGEIAGVPATGVAAVGDTGNALAGRPVIWQIDASLSASVDSQETISGVTITDVLPPGVTYNEEATASVPGGTPATSVTVIDGTTTLTWDLGTLPVNATIAPRIIVTDVDPFVADGTRVVSTARIVADGVIPNGSHTTTHTVLVVQTGELQLKKTVARTVNVIGDVQQYTLRLKNFSTTLSVDAPTVIDVLSSPGDGSLDPRVRREPASAFSGTHRLAGPPTAYLFDGTTPAGGSFLYTTVPPEEVPQSLNDDTNPAIWSETFTPEATAFKFIADSALAPTQGSAGAADGLVIRYETAQAGNVSGDVYANRFTAFSHSFKTLETDEFITIASNQTTVRVVGFSLGDLIWIDTDEDGTYTQDVDEPAPQGVAVSVYRVAPEGPGVLSDELVATARTDSGGRWMVNNLAAGDYRVHLLPDQFGEDGPLSTLGIAPGGIEDPSVDLNEDADHNGVPDGTGGARSGIISLGWREVDGVVRGDEPMGDNVARLPIPPGITDDFTNLTVDFALVPRPMAPAATFTKVADPPSGATVVPGDTIAYTLTVENTGEVPLDVTVTDDLTDVLPYAEVSLPLPAGAALDGNELTWRTPALQPGAAATLTYSVQVRPDAWGVHIRNSATASAKPPVGDVIVIGPVETEHFTPDYAFTKTANPPSGTPVERGQEITYTLTGSNTGLTVLDPVVITDDLSDVVEHADLIDGSATATIEGVADVPQPVESAGAVEWTGRLEPGQEVQVTFRVRVHDDVEGVVLRNVATSSASPGEDKTPLTPPPVETVHPTQGYTFVKMADPVSGTAVPAGGRVTYTLLGTNFGLTRLDPVTITDDLTGVLDHATLVDGSLTAAIDGVPVVPAPTAENGILTWEGALDPGQAVRLTYTVEVKADAQGAVLHNLATSVAVPPEGPAITPPAQETRHPVPGYRFTKTSDPADGSEVARGGRITYTLTGANIGATRLAPVTITDDLAAVLAHASLTGAPIATITSSDGAIRSAATPSVQGTTVRWAGELEVGETVTVTYSVVVDRDAPAVNLVNVAVSAATPPGVQPIVPPPVSTRHRVLVPSVTTSQNPVLSRTGADLTAAGAAMLVLLAVGSGLQLRAARLRRRRS